jgi:hypothetical protein
MNMKAKCIESLSQQKKILHCAASRLIVPVKEPMASEAVPLASTMEPIGAGEVPASSPVTCKRLSLHAFLHIMLTAMPNDKQMHYAA